MRGARNGFRALRCPPKHRPDLAMSRAFTYRSLPSDIRFGPGLRHGLADLLEGAGLSRALVLTTPGQAGLGHETLKLLNGLAVGLFDGARMHTPTEVTGRALEEAQRLGADCLVAVGGGSTIGLSKAVSVRTGLTQIVVPTTYAGSEVTPILGETENGQKVTRRDDAILPRFVVYDPELTYGLPVQISVTSGINALAHAVEALYAPDSSPIVGLMAREAIGVMAGALPVIKADPGHIEARAEALYAAWLCGTCLGSTTMGLHHKICHVLGGSFDLPHAATHCIMLPHVLAYNSVAARPAYEQIGAILDTDRPELALFELVASLDGPLALNAIGMPEAGLDAVVGQLGASPYANPAPLVTERLRAMLADAWAGRPPVRDGAPAMRAQK